jgi:hypothetical protein
MNKYWRRDMKLVLTAILSSAAVFAVLYETPALANGNDPRFEAEQALLHPGDPNQTPNWSPSDIPVGEPYPAAPGGYAFYGPHGVRPLGEVTAPTALAP